MTLSIDEVSDLFYQAAYRKPLQSIKFEEKDEALSVLLDYHLVVKVKGCINQVGTGLETLGVLFCRRELPNVWKPFL